ncbi:hypothetical protein N2152v2_000183 [Parachlorella kessleri]
MGMRSTVATAVLLAMLHVTAGRDLLQTKTEGGCDVINQTLVTGSYLSRYNDLAGVSDCCSRCSSTPQCEIFAYCPADAPYGCTHLNAEEPAGACLLYSLDGAKPTVKQQGPQTLWISGGSPDKGLPTLPAPKQGGTCGAFPNTYLMTGNNVDSGRAATADECCSACNNAPLCDVWSYCNTDEKDQCNTESSYEYGTYCYLFSLGGVDWKIAKVAQQGPETLWVSGYRDATNNQYVPDVNATAPVGCDIVPDTLLTGSDSYITTYSDLQDAETCCERCRNTPACDLWAFCTGDSGEVCYRRAGTEDAGTCHIWRLTTTGRKTDVLVEQRGAETTWVSGFKWPENNTFSDTPPKEVSCTYDANVLKTGSFLTRYTSIPTQDDCCARCTNTPNCGFFSYCPTDATDGCFAAASPGDAGDCSLYKHDGDTPKKELEGKDVLWVSGSPTSF